MSEYHDRGIIKWAAFEALVSGDEILEKLLYNLYIINKPILSEDEYKELDQNLKEALDNDKKLIIKYYKDGYVFDSYGKIKKIDRINKSIILNTGESVKIDDIMDIKIED